MDRGQGIVSRDPEVLNGDLVFAGTRVPVNDLEPRMEEVGRLIEALNRNR